MGPFRQDASGPDDHERTRRPQEADQGRPPRLGGDRRHGGPCPGLQPGEAVFRRLHRVRGRAERSRLAGRCRDARHAAGDQRRMHRPGGAHRPRPQGPDQPALGVRPQELLLPGSAAGIPDLAVQGPDRRRGRGAGRHGRRLLDHRRYRAPAPGAGCRQVAARSGSDPQLRRSEPLGRPADGERLPARPALLGGGEGLRHQAAHDPALPRHLRRRHGEGLAPRRRERLGAPSRRAPRHPLRDQER